MQQNFSVMILDQNLIINLNLSKHLAAAKLFEHCQQCSLSTGQSTEVSTLAEDIQCGLESRI